MSLFPERSKREEKIAMLSALKAAEIVGITEIDKLLFYTINRSGVSANKVFEFLVDGAATKFPQEEGDHLEEFIKEGGAKVLSALNVLREKGIDFPLEDINSHISPNLDESNKLDEEVRSALAVLVSFGALRPFIDPNEEQDRRYSFAATTVSWEEWLRNMQAGVDFYLTSPAANLLKRAGIFTLAPFYYTEVKEPFGIRDLGEVRLGEIKRAVERFYGEQAYSIRWPLDVCFNLFVNRAAR